MQNYSNIQKFLHDFVFSKKIVNLVKKLRFIKIYIKPKTLSWELNIEFKIYATSISCYTNI